MGVHIFWDSRVPIGLSRPVSEELSAVLDTPVSRIDNAIFPLEGYDPARCQYDAVKILTKLDIKENKISVKDFAKSFSGILEEKPVRKNTNNKKTTTVANRSKRSSAKKVSGKTRKTAEKQSENK